MTELQRYLAEEVAEDHADGIITRREAMRRLGLLGVRRGRRDDAARAASARGADGASAGARPRPRAPRRRRTTPRRPTAPSRRWAVIGTQPITFDGPRGTLQGAWAPAQSPRGSVLVIHENRGLTDHIRNVAGRMAANGWSALAIDLLSEEGGTGEVRRRGAGRRGPRARSTRRASTRT